MENEKQLFIKQFNVQDKGFSIPVPFINGFGFSTSKERLNGKYTFISLYKFYINEKEFKNKNILKLITITVSYGEKQEDGSIRLSPLSIKRKLNWPIDLLSADEFFYDIKNSKFYYKNQETTADNIIKKIERLHTKPIRFLTGLLLRSKLFFWRIVVTNLFKFLYYILIKILYIISGINTTRSIWLINMSRDSVQDNKDIKIEEFAKNEINIFGYKSSAWSVVAYSIIHFSLYAIWYFHSDVNNIFIQNIFSNTFLTITYVIPSLVIFERLIPSLIKLLIKYTGLLFHKTSFKRVKI